MFEKKYFREKMEKNDKKCRIFDTVRLACLRETYKLFFLRLLILKLSNVRQ